MTTVWPGSLRRETPRLETRAWLRTVFRAGPERWLWPVALAGWGVLATGALVPHGPAAHLLMWGAMTVGIMLPLIAPNLRTVGVRSPRARQRRATLDTAAGWAVSWLAAGVLLTPAILFAEARLPLPLVVGVVCAGGIAWQFTRSKVVATARSHRGFAPPLSPSAAFACARFGAVLGRDQLLSCWPMMTMMMLAGHHPVIVLPLAWLTWRDMRRPHDEPASLVAVALLAASAVVIVFALG